MNNERRNETREPREGLSPDQLVQQIGAHFVHAQEHGIETFIELARKDPQRAVSELLERIDRTLDEGNGFFRGDMCGGPCELVTAPFLNAVGMIYPALSRDQRERALRACMSFLDNQNYPLSQDNVAYINDPWLVSDILANSLGLYWCGYKEYADTLNKIGTWSDFEDAFMQKENETMRGKWKSFFWLSFAMARKGECNPVILQQFSEIFPAEIDRTKDAIATIINYHALLINAKDSTPYDVTVDDKLTRYHQPWGTEIRQKLSEQKWILLEKALGKIEYARSRSTQQ